MLVVKRLVTIGCLVAALALAGCGGGGAASGAVVNMGVATFQQSGVTVKAGQSVRFVDPTTGGVHIICVGQGAQCVPQASAPAALNTAQGMQFNQGDTHDIVFPTAGTYTIVCIIHPGMQVVVTVTA